MRQQKLYLRFEESHCERAPSPPTYSFIAIEESSVAVEESSRTVEETSVATDTLNRTAQTQKEEEIAIRTS